jgi:hypothetical protein
MFDTHTQQRQKQPEEKPSTTQRAVHWDGLNLRQHDDQSGRYAQAPPVHTLPAKYVGTEPHLSLRSISPSTESPAGASLETTQAFLAQLRERYGRQH